MFCPQHPQEPSESDPSEGNLGDPMPTTYPMEYMQQVVEDEEESYGYTEGNDGVSVGSSPPGEGMETFSMTGSGPFQDSDNEPVATEPWRGPSTDGDLREEADQGLQARSRRPPVRRSPERSDPERTGSDRYRGRDDDDPWI